MKHFEDIWNEAESLSNLSDQDNIEIIKKELDNLKSNKIESFSKILFALSGLSLSFKINVASALQAEIDNIKIEHLD